MEGIMKKSIFTIILLITLVFLTSRSEKDNTFTGNWYSTTDDAKITILNKHNKYDLNLNELNLGNLKNNSIESKTDDELILLSENKKEKISIYYNGKDLIEIYLAENSETPSETSPLVLKKERD